MAKYVPGRLLRVNGRWSLTHNWLTGVDTLTTACGLTYEAGEIYDGDEEVEVFVKALPEEPAFLRCRGCFAEGTGIVDRHAGEG